MPVKNWYAIFVQVGKESKVKSNLQRKAIIEGLEKKVGRVLTPKMSFTELRKGQVVTGTRKKFDGYVFVEATYSPEVYYLIKGLDHVIGVLPDSDNPTPLDANEVEKLLGDEKESKKTKGKPKYDIEFSIGDEVWIKSGAFANMTGVVKDIDQPTVHAEPVVWVETTILGRIVPVELKFWEVKNV
jgi:transcriptional antiterminator NusG